MGNFRYALRILGLTSILSLVFIVYVNISYFSKQMDILRQFKQQLVLREHYIIGASRQTQIKYINRIETKERLTIKPPVFHPAREKELPKLNKTRNFICVSYVGGLGNLMFIFASAFGLARSKNMDLVIPRDNQLLRIFEMNAKNLRIVNNTDFCKNLTYFGDKQHSAFDPRLPKISNESSFRVGLYLQSYKYFENYTEELRSQFTFKKTIADRAKEILLKFRTAHNSSHQNTLIAIHVRRGDMVNNSYGYNVAPKDYFEKVMNWFRTKFPGAIFIVCSNGIPWCKENLKGNDIYFTMNNPREVDMAVLSSCDHIIGSVGSFTWWSSWLSKGIATYFFPPASEGSGLRHHYSADYSDYFLPKWKRF